LDEAGADLSRVVMSHIDRTGFLPETRLKIAKTGCCLEYDGFGAEQRRGAAANAHPGRTNRTNPPESGRRTDHHFVREQRQGFIQTEGLIDALATRVATTQSDDSHCVADSLDLLSCRRAIDEAISTIKLPGLRNKAERKYQEVLERARPKLTHAEEVSRVQALIATARTQSLTDLAGALTALRGISIAEIVTGPAREALERERQSAIQEIEQAQQAQETEVARVNQAISTAETATDLAALDRIVIGLQVREPQVRDSLTRDITTVRVRINEELNRRAEISRVQKAIATAREQGLTNFQRALTALGNISIADIVTGPVRQALEQSLRAVRDELEQAQAAQATEVTQVTQAIEAAQTANNLAVFDTIEIGPQIREPGVRDQLTQAIAAARTQIKEEFKIK